MKKLKIILAIWLGTLFASFERLTAPRKSVVLANQLGLFGEKSETLLLDPASNYNSANPWPGASTTATRFLLVQRGATGYLYGDLSQGVNRPLGVTPDAPYNSADPFAVMRLNAHPGLFLGVASTAITTDHLVVAATNGRIADITTLGNGTYWVVGLAAATIAAAADLGEVPYVPCLPYQITVSGGGGTYALTAPTGS